MVFRINLIFDLLYSSTIWDHAYHRGPGKKEFKTKEILSETSAKTIENYENITLHHKAEKFDLKKIRQDICQNIPATSFT